MACRVLVVLDGSVAAQMVLTLTDGTTTRGSFGRDRQGRELVVAGTGGPMKVAAGTGRRARGGRGGRARSLDDGFRIELVDRGLR